MAKKSSKETTNLPLVISLVFFVLTTIGFGVMWYMAYSEQEKFVADKKKAEDDLKNARGITADSEKVARMYRLLAGGGVAEADDAEKLVSEAKAGDKVSAELKKINDALAAKGGAEFSAIWTIDPDGKIGTPPTTGLIDKAVDANNKRVAAEAAQVKDRKTYQDAVTSFGAAVKMLDEAKDKFAASSVSLPDDFKKKMAKLDADYAARAKLFADTEGATRLDLEKTNDKLVKNEREAKLLKEKSDFQRVEISELVSQLNSKEDKAKLETPLGRILNRHSDGTIEIDLGSDALVKPGLKFTVLPSDYPQKGERSRMFNERSADVTGVFRGKEQWRQKANIEVVEVRGPNLSICRLVPMDVGLSPGGKPMTRLEYDDIRDRVMKGDLIYHPYWKKGTADHVALVGIFDTNGDGVDDIEAVVRDLRATGIPVDAFFDLRTGKWNEGGKLSPRTRSLIIGELPINSGTDPNRDAKSALTAKLEAAIKEAKEKGIRAENYREVFPKMGYYVRVPLPDEKINQATARYLNAPPAETPPGSGN